MDTSSIVDLVLGRELGAYRFLKHLPALESGLGVVVELGVLFIVSILGVVTATLLPSFSTGIVVGLYWLLCAVSLRGLSVSLSSWLQMDTIRQTTHVYDCLTEKLRAAPAAGTQVEFVVAGLRWFTSQKKNSWISSSTLGTPSEVAYAWVRMWSLCLQPVSKLTACEFDAFWSQHRYALQVVTYDGWETVDVRLPRDRPALLDNIKKVAERKANETNMEEFHLELERWEYTWNVWCGERLFEVGFYERLQRDLDQLKLLSDSVQEAGLERPEKKLLWQVLDGQIRLWSHLAVGIKEGQNN